jgi:hypothetical protein
VKLYTEVQAHIMCKSLLCDLFVAWSWGSSVSVVSDYKPEDQSSIPAEAKDLSYSLCAQNRSENRPASCTMGTVVVSPGIKRSRGVTLTTIAEVKNE